MVEFDRIEVNKGGSEYFIPCDIWNGFFVEEGELEIHVFKNDYDLTDKTILGPGDFMSVKPGEYHLFKANKNTIAFEIYWPELLSEDIQRKSVGKMNA